MDKCITDESHYKKHYLSVKYDSRSYMDASRYCGFLFMIFTTGKKNLERLEISKLLISVYKRKKNATILRLSVFSQHFCWLWFLICTQERAQGKAIS